MSFRATIEVCYAGRAADIQYYRNWDELNLLFEAFATALVAERCIGWKTYRDLMRDAEGNGRELTDAETDEIIRDYEEISEYPITVDAVKHRIFLKGEWPYAEKRKETACRRTDPNMDVTALLCGEGVSYSRKELELFRDEILAGKGTEGQISVFMLDLIQRLFGHTEDTD